MTNPKIALLGTTLGGALLEFFKRVGGLDFAYPWIETDSYIRTIVNRTRSLEFDRGES